MIIKTGIIEVLMDIGPDICDITGLVRSLINEHGVAEGLVSLNVVGSTGSLTTIEYEPGVVQDLKDAVERLAPEGLEYKHELAWNDGNGHSHVQAALLGPSISVTIKGGAMQLGTWQQIVVINHDIRARKRKIAYTLLGN